MYLPPFVVGERNTQNTKGHHIGLERPVVGVDSVLTLKPNIVMLGNQ